MAPMNLESAFSGWIAIALAACVVACAGAVLRMVALCRHHIERLGQLEQEETRLKIREKRLALSLGAKR